MTYDEDREDFDLSTWRCPGCEWKYPRSWKCPACGKCKDFCCKGHLSFADLGPDEKRMLEELRRPYDPEIERENNRLMADASGLRKRYEDI